MAVEDGAALGVLLSDLRSTEEVADRLRLFQELRLDRVSAMQIFSSVGQDESARIADSARQYVKGPLPSKLGVYEVRRIHSADMKGAATPEEYHQYNFTPNVMRDALELLESYRGEKLASF